MAETGVTIGLKTKIEIRRSNDVEWFALKGVEDVNFPNAQTGEIEVTHMDSPNGDKEFIPGLNDNGEVAVTTHWVPGSEQDVLILAIRAARELVQLRFTPPGTNATPETYAAFPKGYERVAPVGDKMTSTITFRINGSIED